MYIYIYSNVYTYINVYVYVQTSIYIYKQIYSIYQYLSLSLSFARPSQFKLTAVLKGHGKTTRN